jgi:translation initiation factor 2 subunit 3
VSLHTEDNVLKFAVPGGLIGVETTLDPSMCRSDNLIGQIIGAPGSLPGVFQSLTVSVQLFQRLLGVVQTVSDTKITPVKPMETLLVNIGSTSTACQVINIQDKFANIVLKRPVCASIGERIAFSRSIDSTWRLIGWARILKGEELHARAQ